jgi:hypothetical protein
MVATAAVTLAVGVTVAALGGYLTPRPESSLRPVMAPAPSVVSTPKAEPPAVVLVPVTRRPSVEGARTVPGVPAETESVLASSGPTVHDEEDEQEGQEDDDDGRTGRHELEQEHDD